jgi:CrcB protein
MNFSANLLAIFLGGGLGSFLRYLSYQATFRLIKISTNYSSINQFSLEKLSWIQFPWATFLVNILGSFIAGIIYFFIIKNFDNFSELWKNFLIIGLLGGFTTFSAFSLDFFRLFSANQFFLAFIYAFSSVFISLILVFLGFYLTKLIFS